MTQTAVREEKRKQSSKKSTSSEVAEQQMMFSQAKEPLSDGRQVSTTESEAPSLPNKGTVLVDATYAPANVAYPTDLNLLNEAREKLEAIIDSLHKPFIRKSAKPRTYRENARKQFLGGSKQCRPGPRVIRKAIRRQLG